MSLAANIKATPATAAWAFNEEQLREVMARHFANILAADPVLQAQDFELVQEVILTVLHSDEAKKIRITEGRRTGGLLVPRDRRAVHNGTIVLRARLYRAAPLLAFNGISVLCESGATTEEIRVFNLSGEFITVAKTEYGLQQGDAS